MVAITTVIRFGWVLGIALFFPVALPAGGAQIDQEELRYIQRGREIYAGDSCLLNSSPNHYSIPLRAIKLGTPLRILRSWKSEDGNEWLQVKILSNEYLELPKDAKRGWINL